MYSRHFKSLKMQLLIFTRFQVRSKTFLHLFWSMEIIKNHWDVKSLNEGSILEAAI